MRALDLFYVDLVTRSWVAFWIMCFLVGLQAWFEEERERFVERVLERLRQAGVL